MASAISRRICSRFSLPLRFYLPLLAAIAFCPSLALGQGPPFTGQAEVSIDPFSQAVLPGASFFVDVRIDVGPVTGTCPGGPEPVVLGGYVVPITFDNTRVSYVSVAVCPTAPPQFGTPPAATDPGIANAAGRVAISASHSDPSAPTGDVCVGRLTFQSVGPLGGSSLTPDCFDPAFNVQSQFQIPCPGGPAVIASICVAGTVTVADASDTDLQVFKNDSADPVLPGQAFDYILDVTNNGPSNATGVVVTDTLPAGVTFVSASPGCSVAGPAVTCTIGNLAAAAPLQLTISVTAPGTNGSITNSVSVSGAENDPELTNNSDSETTLVDAITDLSIVKTDSPDPVEVSQNITYTLTAANAGPSNASGVVVTDTLPAGVAFVSASAGCIEAAGVVTCTIGSLASGVSVTSTVVVTAPASPGTLSNTATIVGGETDPSAANNIDTEPTEVRAVADLTLTETDSPDPVFTGQNLTYTFDSGNLGPANATNVVLTANLPINATFVSASAGCSLGGGNVVTCAIGNLSVGGSDTRSVVVTYPFAAVIVCPASIASSEIDNNAANSSPSETTTVIGSDCSPDSIAPVVFPPAALNTPQTTCVGGVEGATGSTSAPVAAFLLGGTAGDNCDTNPTRLAPQVSGVDADDNTLFPIGTTAVTFRFQDAAGNIGSANSDVTVGIFYGDLNQSGAVNAPDSVILSNYLVGNLTQGPPPFTAPFAAADLDVDSLINAVDSVILANYLVGNITCLPL